MNITHSEEEWIKENIEKIPFFKMLSPTQALGLTVGITARNIAGGDIIIRQGQYGDTFFLIYNGKAAVWVEKNNKKAKIAELKRGDYFGEISLMAGRPATATVKANRQTRVFFLDAHQFLALVRDNPDMATAMRAAMEKRLASQKAALATLVDGNVAAISLEIKSFLEGKTGSAS